MSDTNHRSALRALVWKEWRQLRLLRIVGALLCFGVPPLLLIAADLSRRGLLPFGPSSTSGASEVLVDAVPPVMIAALGLLALFVVAQSFVADRAQGLESFLLALPVRRRRVFGVRLASSVASIGLVALAGVAAWALWALPSAGIETLVGSRGPSLFLGIGTLVIGATLTAGLAAAAFVSSPLPVVLAGLVLAVLPVGLATLLGSLFPFATIDDVPIGGVLPLLLFLAYVALSFRALCIGEPAGRGRLRRAGVVLGSSLAATAMLFVTLAAVSVRLTEGSPRDGALTPSPTRALALVAARWGTTRSGWLVDTTSGVVRHRFGRGVWSGSWSPDGRYLAVGSDMGPLGMWRPRLEVYDTIDMRTVLEFRPRHVGLTEISTHMLWTTTGLVTIGWDGHARPFAVPLDGGSASLLAVDPQFLDAHPWTLVGAASSERVYLAVGIGGGRRPLPELPGGPLGRHDQNEKPRLRLHAIDVETGALSPPLFEHDVNEIDSTSGMLVSPAWRLSPSGRYWVASELGSRDKLVVLTIDTAAKTEIECHFLGRTAWLAGDTLVWNDRREDETRLRMWSPATGVRELRAAGATASFHLYPSPDRRRLLVKEFDTQRKVIKRDARVYDVETGAWSEIEGLVAPGTLGAWGGPDVLAFWTEEGFAYRPLE